MNYFAEYNSRELAYMKKFINEIEWLSSYIKEVKRDNTSFHDLIIITNDGNEYTVEVKEDEYYWYSRTGNIGLDYISAFKFNNYDDKNKWRNLWVPSSDIKYFEESIDVKKYGKLVTCDADFQFYFVLDEKKQDFVFARLYSNKKMKDLDFVTYLKNSYSLRINDKNRYGLTDNWESAAFFINPLKDSKLQECEINSVEEMNIKK